MSSQMKTTSMSKFYAARLLLAVALCVVGGGMIGLGVAPVSAQTCTASTCPDGPVRAEFSSPTCNTLPTRFTSLESDFGDFGSCTTESSSYSHKYIAYSDRLEYVRYNVGNCDGAHPDVTIREDVRYFEVCHQQDISVKRGDEMVKLTIGVMYLSDVNATVPRDPPAIPIGDPTIVNLEDVEAVYGCPSSANCDYFGEPPLYYTKSYFNTGCSDYTGGTGHANITAGQCYRTNDATGDIYIQYSCIDSLTLSSSLFSGNGCNFKFRTYKQRVTCAGNGQLSIVCNVASPSSSPSSSPSAAPTSTSPSGSASSIHFSFAALLSLVILDLFI